MIGGCFGKPVDTYAVFCFGALTCVFTCWLHQRHTGRRGSITLFKENLASTANNVKRGYEKVIRKRNKMMGKSRKKLFFFGH